MNTFDFIICGAGSSGSVVASRLAARPDVSVLLLEAGGSDEVEPVLEPLKWPTNIRSERDWGFDALPNPYLFNRVTECAMGKVLGGGSSINALAWVQGHKEDWDFIAAETADQRWGHEYVRSLYQRIESFAGPADPAYRGESGPVCIEQAPSPNPIAGAALDAAVALGIPRLESYNGRGQEGHGGGAPTELIIRNGERRNIFRSYLAGSSDKPNLKIVTGALVTAIEFEGTRACGVSVRVDGKPCKFEANKEVILSLGAIQTPKLLMQSGIGDPLALRKHSIRVRSALAGVGANFQDHASFDVLFEYAQRPSPRNNMAEALIFTRSASGLNAPDLLIVPIEVGKSSPELTKSFDIQSSCWAVRAALLQPTSRGKVTLTGPHPEDSVQIETNFLESDDDLQRASLGIELCREIGNSSSFAPYRKREVLPSDKMRLQDFAREGCVTFHHQTCTAKMGLDEMSVVDPELRVHGVSSLRIADGSVLPKITRGNTMAPCVLIGERAAELLVRTHRLE